MLQLSLFKPTVQEIEDIDFIMGRFRADLAMHGKLAEHYRLGDPQPKYATRNQEAADRAGRICAIMTKIFPTIMAVLSVGAAACYSWPGSGQNWRMAAYWACAAVINTVLTW